MISTPVHATVDELSLHDACSYIDNTYGRTYVLSMIQHTLLFDWIQKLAINSAVQ